MIDRIVKSRLSNTPLPHLWVFLSLNNLGLLYAGRKQYDRATALYRQAIERDKSYIKSYNNLGVALCAQGETDKAADMFRAALAIDPTYQKAAANYNLALSEKCTVITAAAGE